MLSVVRLLLLTSGLFHPSSCREPSANDFTESTWSLFVAPSLAAVSPCCAATLLLLLDLDQLWACQAASVLLSLVLRRMASIPACLPLLTTRLHVKDTEQLMSFGETLTTSTHHRSHIMSAYLVLMQLFHTIYFTLLRNIDSQKFLKAVNRASYPAATLFLFFTALLFVVMNHDNNISTMHFIYC